jgi:hypothetical protein
VRGWLRRLLLSERPQQSMNIDVGHAISDDGGKRSPRRCSIATSGGLVALGHDN